MSSEVFSNIDLLSVGIAIAAIVILGFTIFFNDRRSITNRTFLTFAIVAALWNITNYASTLPLDKEIAIWVLRSVVFFAVWYSFLLFQIFYVFPKSQVKFPSYYWFGLVPLVIVSSLLALTPLVFPAIQEFFPDGRIQKVETAPGIFLFGGTVLLLIGGGIVILFKKVLRASAIEKKPFQIVLIGTATTFLLHIVFNFIFPAFLNNSNFIPLGALFTFPFVGFAAYAIIKHRVLNIKTIATEIFAFTLVVGTFLEIIFSQGIGEVVFRTSVFMLILAFSILLIRGVRREVEQRERLQKLTNDLEKANVELKRLDKMKSEFVSIASHQLRTPLTTTKGYVSMILEGTYGALSKKLQAPVKNVYDSNERLILLVNDLLNLSRIESGKMELNSEETDLVKMIQGLVKELKIKADQKNIKLVFKEPAQPFAHVFLDAEKIRNVMLNLLDNAIRYTEKGSVEISVDQKDNKIRLAVRDTGMGMTKEEIAKLFESFSRGQAGVKLSTEGAGLGLYIAKQFVKMHKGRIWAESKGKGQGSTFYVELPVR